MFNRVEDDAVEIVPQSRSCSKIDSLNCPITLQSFGDPVMTVDGHTFERYAIVNWFKFNDTNPVTNKKLKSKKLTPNWAVKKIAAEFESKSPSPHGFFKSYQGLVTEDLYASKNLLDICDLEADVGVLEDKPSKFGRICNFDRSCNFDSCKIS